MSIGALASLDDAVEVHSVLNREFVRKDGTITDVHVSRWRRSMKEVLEAIDLGVVSDEAGERRSIRLARDAMHERGRRHQLFVLNGELRPALMKAKLRYIEETMSGQTFEGIQYSRYGQWPLSTGFPEITDDERQRLISMMQELILRRFPDFDFNPDNWISNHTKYTGGKIYLARSLDDVADYKAKEFVKHWRVAGEDNWIQKYNRYICPEVEMMFPNATVRLFVGKYDFCDYGPVEVDNFILLITQQNDSEHIANEARSIMRQYIYNAASDVDEHDNFVLRFSSSTGVNLQCTISLLMSDSSVDIKIESMQFDDDAVDSCSSDIDIVRSELESYLRCLPDLARVEFMNKYNPRRKVER